MASIFTIGLESARLDPNAWEKAASGILAEQVITLSEYWRRMIAAFSRHGLEENITARTPYRNARGDLSTYISLKGTRPNGDGSRGGKQRTVRNAEIAFYNEYGTTLVPKRLWMRAANAAAKPELEKIAEKKGMKP